MKIQCSLTADDYVNAQFLHMRPRPVIKFAGYILAILFAVVVIISVYRMLLHGNENIGSCTFFVIVCSLYLLMYFRVLIPLRAKKIFKQQKTLHDPFETEISIEGIATTHPRGNFKMAWKDFHKYKVGRDLILVYQSDAIFHMFPKRWFSDSEYAEFQQYLKEALGNPKP